MTPRQLRRPTGAGTSSARRHSPRRRTPPRPVARQPRRRVPRTAGRRDHPLDSAAPADPGFPSVFIRDNSSRPARPATVGDDLIRPGASRPAGLAEQQSRCVLRREPRTVAHVMPGTRVMHVTMAAFPAAVSPNGLPAAERAALLGGRCGDLALCHLRDPICGGACARHRLSTSSVWAPDALRAARPGERPVSGRDSVAASPVIRMSSPRSSSAAPS